jgi:hypothetical protein
MHVSLLASLLMLAGIAKIVGPHASDDRQLPSCQETLTGAQRQDGDPRMVRRPCAWLAVLRPQPSSVPKATSRNAVVMQNRTSNHGRSASGTRRSSASARHVVLALAAVFALIAFLPDFPPGQHREPE